MLRIYWLQNKPYYWCGNYLTRDQAYKKAKSLQKKNKKEHYLIKIIYTNNRTIYQLYMRKTMKVY